MVLTNYVHDPLLDLDPWVGQRQCSYRFERYNAVTGEVQGDIHPIRGASLSHNSARTIKRTLRLNLGEEDTANINFLQDRIRVFMTFPSGVEYPLGVYMFTDPSELVFTSGSLSNAILNDEMFLVDQQITVGINGVGIPVSTVIETALSGLPIVSELEPSPYISTSGWGIGANRGSIIEALAVAGDFFSPWFDNNGVMRFIRTFNPADEIPDLDLDAGNQVMRAGIVKTSDLLTAPNTFIVVSNNPTDPNTEAVGVAHVPPNAPHSVQNRGFEIPRTENLQLADALQAQAVAIGLVNRQTVLERVDLSTAPDPRYDSYTVVKWQGDLWMGLAWTMALEEGEPMQHIFRRAYRSG